MYREDSFDGEMGRGKYFLKIFFKSCPIDPIFCTVVAFNLHARHVKSQSNNTFC